MCLSTSRDSVKIKGKSSTFYRSSPLFIELDPKVATLKLLRHQNTLDLASETKREEGKKDQNGKFERKCENEGMG